MADFQRSRPGPGRGRPARPQDERGERSRPGRAERPRTEVAGTTRRPSASSVSGAGLEKMAEQLEEQGRALLEHARQLRQMAATAEERSEPRTFTPRSSPSTSSRGDRPPRRDSGGGSSREGGGRAGGGGRDGSKSRPKQGGGAPKWAPSRKKRSD